MQLILLRKCCYPTPECCAGDCVNTYIDPVNCGACGNGVSANFTNRLERKDVSNDIMDSATPANYAVQKYVHRRVLVIVAHVFYP